MRAGGQLLGYYLKEESGWSMDIAEVRKQVQAARDRGIAVRAVVFINPGAAQDLFWWRPHRCEHCICDVSSCAK